MEIFFLIYKKKNMFMEKKKRKKKNDELLKNKKEEESPLREVIEYEDDEVNLIQDTPSKNINRKDNEQK